MSDDIRTPEPADDDIPVLTDIVVPGRLQPATQTPGDATPAAADFVFDIDFATGERGVGLPPLPASEPFPAPAATPPTDDLEPAPSAELDLPLPWAQPTSPPARKADDDEPRIVAALAKATATPVEPPDAEAQTLLRELLAEIGAGLEQRLARELADTERRLRVALREELDTRLRELLAGAPPKI